jgi:hypothetical protein
MQIVKNYFRSSKTITTAAVTVVKAGLAFYKHSTNAGFNLIQVKSTTVPTFLNKLPLFLGSSLSSYSAAKSITQQTS